MPGRRSWRLFLRLLALATLMAAPSLLAAVAEFHVSPRGDDAQPGTAAQPFASLDRARRAIRALKAATGLPPGGVVVHVGPGTYALPSAFTLTPEDSGTAAAPIVYQGAETAPLFSGGSAITGWRELEPGLWAADLAEVRAGRWYFEQLWVNSRRATRARSPNRGWYYIDLKGGYGPLRPDGTAEDFSPRRFRALHADDFAGYATLTGTALNDVTLSVLWPNWIATRLRVASVTPASRQITVTGAPGTSTHTDFDRGVRYAVENFRAALDAPGEWFLDRAGTLYYRPLPGETLATAAVIAPRLRQLLVIAGEPAAGRLVEHVTFRGLRFQHADTPTPPGGQPEAQGAANIPAAVLADGARHVQFEGCEIAHVGGYALHFRHGCHTCAVRQCHLHDLGAGGIHLGGGRPDEPPAPHDHSSHFEIVDNILRAGGRVHPGACAILSHHCSDSRIAHNDIADFFYTGISVGWTWHYRPSLAQRNTIAFNRLGHLGQGVLSDLAGIYTLGESHGTTIIGNVIHDVHAYKYGASGIYTDQATTGVRITENLTYRTESAGFTMNFGQDVVVENNIFALTEAHALHKGMGREESSLRFARNIVWTDRGEMLEGGWRAPTMRLERNLYWHAARRPVALLGLSLEKWQLLGKDRGSLIADPLFENPAQLDFRLRPGSPAEKIGFVPFDPARAGVRGSAAWRARAAASAPSALQPEVLPPALTPLELAEDFEATPLDHPPALAKVEPTWAWPHYGLRVAVAADPARGGNRYLKMTEERRGLEAWAPMVVYAPAHREGRTRLSFEVQPGRTAHLAVSLEDRSAKGFATQLGPQLSIRDGKLLLLGHAPIEIPREQWSRLTLTVALGRRATGAFDLTLTRPDGTSQTFPGIRYRTPGWNFLHWLSFSSAGEDAGTVGLDNITLVNEPLP